LERVRSACTDPDRHIVTPLDLSDADTLRAAAEDVRDRAGPVDLMIHNGGISQRSLVQNTDLSVDRRIMEVNYFGAVTLTKRVLPSMLERGQGHFVVISSVVGKFGTPKRSAYAASKHALHGFFDSLRAEVHDAGVHVTIVCPGFVETNVAHNALTDDGTPLSEKKDEVTEVGIPPMQCARQIARAIERNKSEVTIGGWETMGVYAKRFVPSLFNAAIRRISM
jgi:short-subunit dehydrogenase